MAVSIAFAVLIVAGWLILAYLAFFTPGGLQGAWQSVRGLPLIVQILMWLLLLPWMLALWFFHFTWPLWIRIILVLGLAWATYFMSVPPMIQALRTPK